MTGPSSGILRDAAAPLALITVILAGAVVVADVQVALTVAGLASSTEQPIVGAVDLIHLGLPALLAASPNPPLATAVLIASIVAELAAVAGGGALGVRRPPPGDTRRSLLRRRELGDLAGSAADLKARGLRPSLTATDLPPSERGIRLLTVDGRDTWMSWEDVALILMGPRSNKTSALAVPAVLSAPGLVVATSNKADLWALTSGLRARHGPVWTFDPQQIAFATQTWWWDPLRSIREAPESGRYEAAARLADHFMGTIGGNRRDPFFHAAGEQVLIGTLLAAALSDGTLREVMRWLQNNSRAAITALDDAGARAEAADLESSLAGADVTTKGIFQTARTATKALTSERILRWVTPPDTWRATPPSLDKLHEIDPWEILAAGADGHATLHLLSKEGAGTAAPVVAALVDRVLEVAEQLAQARGGRLDPPVVAVLDEAANICPIRQLPQLYSHYGSRGIQVLTMLQSYQQGVGVWGAQGMDALWSAATVKLVGAGVDDHSFLQRLSGLIGDHEVPKVSVSHTRSGGPSRQYSTARQPIMPASTLRALPKTKAVLLTTGRRAAVGELRPWYREHAATDIRSYFAAALAELTDAAQKALGPNRMRKATP